MKKLSFFSLAVTTLVLSSCSQSSITPSAQPTVTALPTSTMAPTSQPASNPMVTMETSMGMVKIELFKDQTPLTVENFLKLAREGFYDGVIFHRVIPNFMAQTGDPNSKDADPYNDGTGGPGYTFNDELVKNLSNVRGTMSMANRGPNTNGSQFFINIVDNTFLDGRHAVFGKVIEGLDIVDKIVNVPTRKDDPRLKDRPVKDVKIIKVSIAN